MLRVGCLLVSIVFWLTSASAQDASNAIESSREMFLLHVEKRDWLHAQYFMRTNNDTGWRVLKQRWEVVRQDDTQAGVRLRFELVDFILRFGDSVALKQQDLRDEYVHVCEQLKIAMERRAVIASSLDLLDRHCNEQNIDFYRPSKQLRTDTLQIYDECIRLLRERPEDNAVFHVLDVVARRNSASMKDFLDYELLMNLCNTDESRIRLVTLASRRFQRDVPFDVPICERLRRYVFESLPLFANDDERARTIWRFCIEDRAGNQLRSDQTKWLQRGYEELVKRYPESRYTTFALTSLMCNFAWHGGLDAIDRSLDSDLYFQRLPDAEKFQVQFVTLDRLRSEEDRKRLSYRLWQRYSDRSYRVKLLDAAIEHYHSTTRFDVRKQLSNSRYALLDPSERLSGNIVAPEIASNAMSDGDWKKALQVWRQWNPDNLGCMNWNVYPHEEQLHQIAVCQLHLQRYEDAIATIASGLEPGCEAARIGSRTLPFLLFHLYAQADQLDDLKDVVIQWAQQGVIITRGMTSNAASYRNQVPPIELTEVRDWGVWQMFAVRELASRGEVEKLITICKYSDDTPFYHTKSTYSSNITSAGIAMEAARQIALLGDRGVELVQQVHFALMNDPSETSDLNPWLIYSVLINESANAKKWILELGKQATEVDEFDCKLPLLSALRQVGPEGMAILQQLAELDRLSNSDDKASISNIYVQNATRFLDENEAMISPRLDWPAPAKGTLPKAIKLAPR